MHDSSVDPDDDDQSIFIKSNYSNIDSDQIEDLKENAVANNMPTSNCNNKKSPMPVTAATSAKKKVESSISYLLFDLSVMNMNKLVPDFTNNFPLVPYHFKSSHKHCICFNV